MRKKRWTSRPPEINPLVWLMWSIQDSGDCTEAYDVPKELEPALEKERRRYSGWNVQRLAKEGRKGLEEWEKLRKGTHA